MIKALELRALELTPHLYSDAIALVLGADLRDAQSRGPGRTKQIFQFTQQLPAQIFHHLDSVFFASSEGRAAFLHVTALHL
jgi:hypothetical protein